MARTDVSNPALRGKTPEYREAFLAVARCHDAGLGSEDPRMIRAWARYGLAHWQPILARAEVALAGGVCTKGPRKGQPYKPTYRLHLADWVMNLREMVAREYAALDSVEPLTVEELVRDAIEGVEGAR